MEEPGFQIVGQPHRPVTQHFRPAAKSNKAGGASGEMLTSSSLKCLSEDKWRKEHPEENIKTVHPLPQIKFSSDVNQLKSQPHVNFSALTSQRTLSHNICFVTVQRINIQTMKP